MNAMTEFLPEAWRWVLEATLQAYVIVAVIRVLQLALGKRLAPRWHYALWLVLLARMVMPWAPESSVSLFNLIEIFRTPAPQAEPMPYSAAELPLLSGTPILASTPPPVRGWRLAVCSRSRRSAKPRSRSASRRWFRQPNACASRTPERRP